MNGMLFCFHFTIHSLWLHSFFSASRARRRLQLQVEDDPDDARIVTVRRVDDLVQVEADVGADAPMLHALYDAQKEISATLEPKCAYSYLLIEDALPIISAPLERSVAKAPC